MARIIKVGAPSATVDALVRRLQAVDGVMSLSLQRTASLRPPGDVLSIHATNDAARAVLKLLDEHGVARSGWVWTSAPKAYLCPAQARVGDESNETVWEEMAFLLREDTNVSINYLLTMGLAGAIAAGGLWTNTLHIIVGAMIIAPAFEPLVRFPFALIAGGRRLAFGGLQSAAAGYLVMALGAALATLLLQAWGGKPADALAGQQWMRYWSTLTFPGLLMSVFGGLAGAVVISGLRSVLTTGVMITLALIPSMAVVGTGVAIGDPDLATQGLLRWGVDALLVMTMSAAVFALKQRLLHRRRQDA